MHTDKVFHEYFQIAPQAFFELLQITPGCAYNFSSPVVKAVERRMDGLLEPAEPGFPRYFLEIQGYADPLIYWRTLQEVVTYHTQNPDFAGLPFQVVILFLESNQDPGRETLANLQNGADSWLTTAVLPDLLEAIPHPSAVLQVLQAMAADENEVQKHAREWYFEITQASDLLSETRQELGKLLVQLVMQRLKHMSRQEIDDMFELTPIEETRAGRELIEIGREQGIEQGIEQGLRYSILDLLEVRFPADMAVDAPFIAVQLDNIDDPAELRSLHRQAALVESLEAFQEEFGDSI